MRASTVLTVASLTLGSLACPSEKRPPPAPVQATPPPEPAREIVALGPLKFSLPEGFSVVQNLGSSLMLRHTSDLTVTLGISHKTDPVKDESTIDTFLASAETELAKLNEARVARETRTLPGSTRTVRGVVAHTVDRNGTPVNERREMWVLSDGPAIITASFIFLEDAPASVAGVEQMLELLREAADAMSKAAP